MAEIRLTLRKDLGVAVCLRADLADCPDAMRTLGLLLPALRLVRFIDGGAGDQGQERRGKRGERATEGNRATGHLPHGRRSATG